MPTLLWFILSLVLLLLGAELLVRGAARLAAGVGISPLVVGLTVVAYGTSAPELAVSVKAALSGQADISLGNVVGSNIFNVLVILGLSAVFAPLLVSAQLLRFDVWLMIGASLAAFVFGLDGQVSRLDGLLLVATGIAYTVWVIRQSRKESREVQAEFAQEYRPFAAGSKLLSVGRILLGLGTLVFAAHRLVDSSTAIAHSLGISDLIIGLTIVAAGTSLPELATSAVAAFRGERDIAVGNVVGSNIFNLLIVLGGAAAIGPGGVNVSSTAVRFDLPVMIAVAVACLPIFFTGNKIDRWEGFLFIFYYLAYLGYLILDTANSTALRGYQAAMLWFVLPLTALTLGIVFLHSRARP